jgi:hypothetical protein
MMVAARHLVVARTNVQYCDTLAMYEIATAQVSGVDTTRRIGVRVAACLLTQGP